MHTTALKRCHLPTGNLVINTPSSVVFNAVTARHPSQFKVRRESSKSLRYDTIVWQPAIDLQTP